jgi:ATP-dependent Lon protease
MSDQESDPPPPPPPPAAIEGSSESGTSGSGTSGSESESGSESGTSGSESESESGTSDKSWKPEENDSGMEEEDIPVALEVEDEEEAAIVVNPRRFAQQHQAQLIICMGSPHDIMSAGTGAPATRQRQGGRPKKKPRVTESEERFVERFNDQEYEYWSSLDEVDKKTMLRENKIVELSSAEQKMPLRFRVLRSSMPIPIKRMLLQKIDDFKAMREGSGEYNKLQNWLNQVSRLPLGVYKELAVKPSDTQQKIADYIQGVRMALDQTVYGQTEAKDQMMRIIAQWASNPAARGHCIGLVGSPGCGKTALVKSGIATALGLSFGFVALGGAADGSFLEGHSFTYEGSTYGKIAEILMKSGSMNPIIFFDELDKVSHTHRGEEIIGILTHLTDPSQNDRYCDKYFSDIDLDLSKALIIFSFNDESLINPILKDRMVVINVPGYSHDERRIIAKDYLLPEILQQHNLTKTDITVDDEVLDQIISFMPDDKGVRNLKRALESIVSWINMNRYLPEDSKSTTVTLPVQITEAHVKKYMKAPTPELNPSIAHMYL